MSDSNNYFWWRLKLEIPIELEESLIWKCEKLAIKTFAIELNKTNEKKLIFWAWLPSFEIDDHQKKNLIESIEIMAQTFRMKLPLPIWEKVSDEDWSSSWKRFWRPDPVGNALLILPAWLELPNVFSNKVVIKIDPGSAFGTGSHPTTRLCLEALGKMNLKDLKIADIGCGSGILSLAALKLGAKEVFAVDVDSLAIRATHENASLNNCSKEKLKVLLGSIEELKKNLKGEKVDLIFCNILAPVIKVLAPELKAIASHNAQALFSGLLLDQMQDIKGVLEDHRWKFIHSSNQENWALMHLCRSQV